MLRTLSVLMWKHAVVRLRRFIHTTVDLVAPLLFILLIFLFKNLAHPEQPGPDDPERDPVSYTEVLPLSETRDGPRRLFYYPDSALTASLMDDVGPKLNLNRVKFFPEHPYRGYYGIANNTQLNCVTAKLSRHEALVVFKDMTGETWPNRLNYTIRMKESSSSYEFKIDRYEVVDSQPGPHRMFGLNYGTFMQIQWAIDTSFIKLLTGSEVPHSISIQEFPYYRTKDPDMAMAIMCEFFGPICFLSLLLTFVFVMSRLLSERASGIQELMKMVGVSLNMLAVTHWLNVLPCGLVFSIGGTILFKSTDNPMIPNTSGLVLFVALILYFNFIVSMAFFCSYITKSEKFATALAVLFYILLWLPSRYVNANQSHFLYLVAGLLPHKPMAWFWGEVGAVEVYDKGISLGNMTQVHKNGNASVLTAFFFLILQSAIFYFLTWYLSLVRPGQFGTALPWNFLCKAHYWRRGVTPIDMESDETELVERDPRFFEPLPPRAHVGIKVDNVTKIYTNHKALRNVSLEVLKGEITILVGHNGAGKTTLMSIITGMTSATEGKIYVNGLDTVEQKSKVRKQLGLCPQHNMFFFDLTVREHIMFFTMLKHGTYSEARESANRLAEKLGIAEKLKTLTRNLSGGMKRRAQLACALAGDAHVLVLDEPTSGLDVETRRELWDLLLSLRGDHTVLLSTHFMEEADALGDRVAALHGGTLRCFASCMHLKKAIGTGYRLSLTTIGLPKEAAITSVVTSHVPDASLKEHTINTLSYNLPATATSKFPRLFASLEAKRASLDIDSIGVGVSTLEEVFLKLCSDVDTSFDDDEVDTAQSLEGKKPASRGLLLYWQQFVLLFKRQVKYAIHKKWSFLILQIILPVLMIALMTLISNNEASENKNSALSMDLDVYSDRTDRRVLYRATPDINMKALLNKYSKVSFAKSDDVAEAVLRTGKRDIMEYNKYLVGVEINDTDAKILYTTTVRHAAPVALNLLSNMLATRYISWADGQTIATRNSPIQPDTQLSDIKKPKDNLQICMWGFFITFIILATLINCISLPCQERETGSRHIHIMCGCPAPLHWTSTLAWHLSITVVSLVLPTVLSAILIERDDTINRVDLLGAFTMSLLLGSMAFLSFTYLISFNFGERGTSIILVAYIFVFGMITPLTKMGHMFFEDEKGVSYYFVEICGYLAVPHTMTSAALKALYVGRLNAVCDVLRPQCPNIMVPEKHFNVKTCCGEEEYAACFFCSDDIAPGPDMLILLIQFIVFFILVWFTELGYFNGLVDKLLNTNYRPTEPAQVDEFVAAERQYVSKAIELPDKQITDAMLVDDLHKCYASILSRKCVAVQGISFSVKKGECFGLLGVNGAGKSTTFKILTAEECATKGRIFGNGHRLKRGNPQYLQSLGYCPQFFGLDMFLTGHDNLSLVLTLRGYDSKQVKEEVKSWIEVVGLEKYARRRVEAYSGGCVRRLGAAAALCGGAGLVLLDEPTAGVDVAARRKLWNALRRGLKQQRSVIITSHSMDEMEALCSRIAIMSAGRVRALGSAASLRALHAAGHAVIFKLTREHHTEDETDGAAKETTAKLNSMKEQLQHKFNCTIKDEHKTLLHYHINDTLPYSELFSELEALKAKYPDVIEDYSVTETTLEEVFLAFARETQETA